MTIKEKVIRKSIKKIKKELENIDFLINAKPLSEIIKARECAQSLLNTYTTTAERTSPQFLEKFEVFVEKESKAVDILNKTKNISSLYDKKLELEFELNDLQTELYKIKNLQHNGKDIDS